MHAELLPCTFIPYSHGDSTIKKPVPMPFWKSLSSPLGLPRCPHSWDSIQFKAIHTRTGPHASKALSLQNTCARRRCTCQGQPLDRAAALLRQQQSQAQIGDQHTVSWGGASLGALPACSWSSGHCRKEGSSNTVETGAQCAATRQTRHQQWYGDEARSGKKKPHKLLLPMLTQIPKALTLSHSLTRAPSS